VGNTPAESYFGVSIAISGTTVAVGAPDNDVYNMTGDAANFHGDGVVLLYNCPLVAGAYSCAPSTVNLTCLPVLLADPTTAPSAAGYCNASQFGYSVALATMDGYLYLAVGAPALDITVTSDSVPGCTDGMVVIYNCGPAAAATPTCTVIGSAGQLGSSLDACTFFGSDLSIVVMSTTEFYVLVGSEMIGDIPWFHCNSSSCTVDSLSTGSSSLGDQTPFAIFSAVAATSTLIAVTSLGSENDDVYPGSYVFTMASAIARSYITPVAVMLEYDSTSTFTILCSPSS